MDKFSISVMFFDCTSTPDNFVTKAINTGLDFETGRSASGRDVSTISLESGNTDKFWRLHPFRKFPPDLFVYIKIENIAKIRYFGDSGGSFLSSFKARLNGLVPSNHIVRESKDFI